MKKRLLCLLLASFMVVTMLPCLASTAKASDVSIASLPNTISAGERQAVAIKQDGSLWSWGNDNRVYPTPDIPVKLMDKVVSVSAGWGYAAAICEDNSLWTWGSRFKETVGNTYHYETVDYSKGPFPVKLMDDVVATSVGRFHMAAICSDGSLWTWGGNMTGQLGNGQTSDLAEIVPTKIMKDVVAVSAGGDFTAAITSDGSLWTWGGNSHGQLGNGSTVNSYKPVKVMDDVIAVSAGMHHTAAITSDGSLWTWGWNVYGQLGNGGSGNIIDQLGSKMRGDDILPYSQTVLCKVMSNVISVSAGGWHTAAITSDGSLLTWGSNLHGILGNGTTKNSTSPIKVLDNVVAVSAGGYLTMALLEDGSLWTWGGNTKGALGNGGIGNNVDDYGNVFQTTPLHVMNNVKLPDKAPHTSIIDDGRIFLDVPTDVWYADGVKYVEEHGMMNGIGDRKFGPLFNVNRSMVATILYRMEGSPTVKFIDDFVDVQFGQWYSDAVIWSSTNDIIGNCTNRRFGPNDNITRTEFVTILYRFSRFRNYDLTATASLSQFTDTTQLDQLSKTAFQWAITHGLVNGTSNTTLSPNSPLTRAEVATILMRFCENWNLKTDLISYNGTEYKLVSHDIQVDTTYNINISEWYPLEGLSETMLASFDDSVEEIEGINSNLNLCADVFGFVFDFLGNSHKITNLNVAINSNKEMVIRYGSAIELNKSGKKVTLENLLIEKYSSAYPSILFSASTKADELIREWFSLDGNGQYYMEMNFAHVHLGDCGYYLIIEDGELYQIPLLHKDTELNIYYKENGESTFLFDAADILRNVKIKMSSEEASKVINKLNSEGYNINLQ